jgi:hypothetical protein
VPLPDHGCPCHFPSSNEKLWFSRPKNSGI